MQPLAEAPKDAPEIACIFLNHAKNVVIGRKFLVCPVLHRSLLVASHCALTLALRCSGGLELDQAGVPQHWSC